LPDGAFGHYPNSEMAELPPELQAAVEDQAQARVEMSIQGYAKYLTPEAIDSLRASFPGIPPRVSAYSIASVETRGSEYVVEVSYSSRNESFQVRSRWRKDDDGWKVAHAERLWAEGQKRPGPLSRLADSVLRFFARLRR
jgi:hypothetical protein